MGTILAGDMFIALFHRNATDSFHWIIALATSPGGTTFVKYHARTTLSGAFVYEVVSQSIFEDQRLVALVKIGTLPQGCTWKTIALLSECYEKPQAWHIPYARFSALFLRASTSPGMPYTTAPHYRSFSNRSHPIYSCIQKHAKSR